MYILFGQKVYTFLVKSIYFFQKEIMILYISDIQPIMLFSTIQLFRSDPPLGKMAADKEFPMPLTEFDAASQLFFVIKEHARTVGR